jgi:hypothetical protein
VGQDVILRAGWQPALYGPLRKLRQAGYQIGQQDTILS